MRNEDDEAITLPLYSGPGLLQPRKTADGPRPQRSVSVRQPAACHLPPLPHTARAKPVASALPLAHDRIRGHEFLTPEEAAALLRTSRKAIYAMAERHQLPGATRIGRRLLVRRDDLLSWLDERRAASPGGTRR
jgi:excisionase family DNA binding protein